MNALKLLPVFAVIWLVFLLVVPSQVIARQSSEQTLQTVAFNQKIGQPLPDNITFRNANGERIPLNALAQEKPLVLVLSWFECPNLCPMLLDKLAAAAKRLPFESNEYNIATISIDPGEGRAQAREFRQRLTQKYGDLVKSWQFLTGSPETIAATTQTVGFQYAYDAERDSYAHPAGFVVIAPGGEINRYIFGIEPNTPDLKLALLEAGKGQIGTAVDQVVLRCYRFNPDSGQYNLAVTRLLQAAGGTFILAMVLLFWWMRRRVWWMRRRGAP
jgi:protein SCO1/2